MLKILALLIFLTQYANAQIVAGNSVWGKSVFAPNLGSGPQLDGSPATCVATGSSTTTCTVAPNTGDMMIIAIASQVTPASIAGNSNTFVKDEQLNESGTDFITLYRIASVAAGTTSIVIGNNFGSMATMFYYVKGSGGAFDQGTTNGSASTTTTLSTGTTSTLSNAVDFVVGACQENNGSNAIVSGPTNSFTGQSELVSGGSVNVILLGAYNVTSSTTGVTTGWTLTTAQKYGCAIGAYH